MILVAELTSGQTAARLIALFVVAALFSIAAVDVWWEYRGESGVAQRLQGWTGQNRLLAIGLAILLWALIGHFYFWEPWCIWSTPCS